MNWVDEMTVVEQIRQSARDVYYDPRTPHIGGHFDSKAIDKALRFAMIRLDLPADESPKWLEIFMQAIHEAERRSFSNCIPDAITGNERGIRD